MKTDKNEPETRIELDVYHALKFLLLFTACRGVEWLGIACYEWMDGWTDGWTPWTLLLVPTLYFWFSKVLVESSPTSFFLFSPTNSAATWAGRTFSSSSRVKFSQSSISSLSVRFLFFSRNSWRQQNSSCKAEEGFQPPGSLKIFSPLPSRQNISSAWYQKGCSWKASNVLSVNPVFWAVRDDWFLFKIWTTYYGQSPPKVLEHHGLLICFAAH